MPTRLSAEAVDTALSALPAWTHEPERPALHRTFRFSGFPEAWAFMSQCALAAERLQHHPEWRNVWATVEVTLTTHDCGGISALDLELARVMDAVAGRRLG